MGGWEASENLSFSNAMATQGISLHLGLNRVDPVHYAGWDGALTACEFDAKDMRDLAKSRGFKPTVLLTPQATSDAVQTAIVEASKKLVSGDIFFLTYSGHGGQVPDRNKDEPDGQDETWVLYDRELVDDELWALWAKFKAGVRILVLSDSCHSGSVTRAMPPRPGSDPGWARVGRLMPPAQALKVYRKHKKLYDGIQKVVPAGDKAVVKASVILISGCQDNQLSLDGKRNGLFTETLKKVWKKGAFKGSYRRFRDTIVQKMPPDQTPRYSLVGKVNPAFEAQVPFTL